MNQILHHICYTTQKLVIKSYFENLTIELHVLYVLNMHNNFHTTQI